MGVLDFVLSLTGKKKSSAALIDPKEAYRNDEQEKAVFYFSEENKKKGCFGGKGCFAKKPKSVAPVKSKGCFPKKKFKLVTDAEYDALVESIVQRLDPKNSGLKKLGLDQSEIEKTISFKNYVFKFKNRITGEAEYTPFWKFGEDGRFRSAIFEVTYLFFTRDEIAAYQLPLSSDWEKHDENTFEYHFKDITSLRTNTLQQDEIENGEKVYKTVENEFLIIVPGDSFSVSLNVNPTKEEEDAIQGMKSLLREKKNA
jgi:hypothetical protein